MLRKKDLQLELKRESVCALPRHLLVRLRHGPHLATMNWEWSMGGLTLAKMVRPAIF